MSSNLWVTGQISPTACFCLVFKLRMSFTFLNSFQIVKKDYFITDENHVKFKFQCYKLLLDHSHAHLHILSMAAFLLQWQS